MYLEYLDLLRISLVHTKCKLVGDYSMVAMAFVRHDISISFPADRFLFLVPNERSSKVCGETDRILKTYYGEQSAMSVRKSVL